ncbi:MAG: AAA family ATPase [Bacillota bacterium]|jgi:AAA+ ATPase superfamily predicted ATPase
MPTKFFPLGGPVPGEDIVGRDDLLMSLEMRLSEGQSVMLASPRRTGKTSIAHEIIRRFKSKNYYTIFIDVFQPATKKELTTLLIDSCLENRTGIKKTTDTLKKGIKSLATSAKLTFRLKDLELDILLDLDREGKEEVLLSYALELPEKLGRLDNKKVLVVFDEFQDFQKFNGDNIFKTLRSHFQNHQYVTYLFLGSKKGTLENLFSHSKEAFFRFATIVPMPEIPEEKWIEYIQKKFSTKKIAAPETAVKEIIRFTGGHPQDTMAVCSEIYYILLESNIRMLSTDVVRIGFERAKSSLIFVFDNILDDIGKNVHTRKILKKIAIGDMVYQGEENPAEVKRAIDLLLTAGIIEKTARGKYEFYEPMFKEYLLDNTF